MIRIALSEAQGEPRRLEVTGHAGQGAYGEDIVCAGVSALVETLSLAMDQVIVEAGEKTVADGMARFCWRSPLTEVERAVVTTFVVGLQDLANSYPEFVRFTMTPP